MKFLTYLNDKKPEVIQVPIEVEMELPKIKVELTFIGSNEEIEVYTEFYTPYVEPFTREFTEEAIDILKEFMIKFTSVEEGYFLDFNQRILLKDYYKLSKAVIKDVTSVKKKLNVIERKIVKE